MTVLTTTSWERKLGNGATTVFPFSIVFLDNSDLVVTRINADASRTLLAEGTHYTLSGATNPSGGTLTTTPGNTLPAGASIVIDRQVPATQLVDLVPNSALPADTLERSLDKLTMLAQELEYTDARSLRLDPFDPATGINPLPPKSLLPGKLLTFDGAGEPIASSFTDGAVAALVAGSVVSGSPLLEFNFVGDGVTDTFNLGSTVPSTHSLFVAVDGVFQPTSSYTVSTTNVVFTEAPPVNAVINIRTFFAIEGAFVPDSMAVDDLTVATSLTSSGSATLAAATVTGAAALGNASANRLVLNAGGTRTISVGAITVTASRHAVDTEGAASSDDLDTINGGVDGQILIIYPANDARTVVAKDGTGNLQLAGDFSMDNSQDRITLLYDGASWVELARSGNGA